MVRVVGPDCLEESLDLTLDLLIAVDGSVGDHGSSVALTVGSGHTTRSRRD